MNAPRTHRPTVGPHGGMLPRSVGVLVTAFGALLCWGALIGLVQAIS